MTRKFAQLIHTDSMSQLSMMNSAALRLVTVLMFQMRMPAGEEKAEVSQEYQELTSRLAH
jgi:hypothetical protein